MRRLRVCVQVCPTGIDIRNGLQYECIGCAACIDGCDQIMDKMGYPRGLIRYTTENVVKGKYPDSGIIKHILRPRTIIYTALLTVIAAAFVTALLPGCRYASTWCVTARRCPKKRTKA